MTHLYEPFELALLLEPVEGPLVKRGYSSLNTPGCTVKMVSHNWLSIVDHTNDLFLLAFCLNL